jgi:cell division septum initiation protein DivIVA
MELELNQEELGQVLQTMRVLLPDLSGEKFRSLLIAQENLSSAGFLESVWGIVRLQQETGINLTQAIDEYRQLLHKNEKLVREQESLKKKCQELEEMHEHLSGHVTAAKEELEAIRSNIDQGKKELTTLAARAESEKKKIEIELEECRQKAGVAEEEIKAAGFLKTKVNKTGFNLETMLALAKEFARYQDARERLVEALEQEGSLIKRISCLEEETKEKENALTSAIAEISSRKTEKEDELKSLKNICHQWELNLKQLQSDVHEEQRLRQFMVRYQANSRLLDCLASWKQVVFLRCENLGCEPFRGLNHFWSEKLATRCPHCGSGNIDFDTELYDILGLEMRPFKLILG